MLHQSNISTSAPESLTLCLTATSFLLQELFCVFVWLLLFRSRNNFTMRFGYTSRIGITVWIYTFRRIWFINWYIIWNTFRFLYFRLIPKMGRIDWRFRYGVVRSACLFWW